MRTQSRVRAIRPLVLLLLLGLLACGRDEADRLLYAALEGEETDMTREEQIALLDRAIALEPARVGYWETRAIYRIDLRHFEQAEAGLDRAIEIADRPYLRYLRGQVRCQQGRYLDSLPDFDLAIADQPGNTQFYWGRSLARVAVGQPQAALADAEKALELGPPHGRSFYARGMALAALDRCGEALADFGEVVQSRPELVYAVKARADCYEQLGDPERAVAARHEFERLEKREENCNACLDPFRY